MKTLKEFINVSILDDEDVLVKNAKDFIDWKIIYNKTKHIIDNVLNSYWFRMRQFIEENGLKLNKENVKKIINKLKKTLPKGAIFGVSYNIPQIGKQEVEKYDTINYTDLKYAYYKIEIAYGTKPWGPYGQVLKTTVDEFIIYLTEDCIYALDIPETNPILNRLDEYFNKYTTQDKVMLSNTYKIKSNTGGKYRIYSFKDITKEFIIRK